MDIPYLGTLVGFPRKPAAEYHISSAVLSAVVIPIAADLAFGSRYEPDRLVANAGTAADPRWEFRNAVAFRDLGQQPIRGYHRAISACFASGITAPVPPWAATQVGPGDCAALKFADLPSEGLEVCER